jgi:hypothetical protein
MYLVRENPKSHCGCKDKVATFPVVEYTTWNNMIMRCYNESHISYPSYGAKGVRVDARWLPQPYGELTRAVAFANFLADMGYRPDSARSVQSTSGELGIKNGIRWSIDRRDATGPYGPQNCRWATDKDQGRNKRGTVYVTLESGDRIPAAQLAEDRGISYNQLRNQLIKEGKWNV